MELYLTYRTGDVCSSDRWSGSNAKLNTDLAFGWSIKLYVMVYALEGLKLTIASYWLDGSTSVNHDSYEYF